MKDFMTNLYSYDYKAKTETDEDDDAGIHFMITNEGLDVKNETVKWLSLRSRGNPQRFLNHQNQIVRTVKRLNQQLSGGEAPKRVRYNVNGRLRFETLKKIVNLFFFL